MLTEASGAVTALPRESKRARPILLWALVGGGFVALALWMWVGALVAGDLRPTPVGPSPVPTWLRISVAVWQVVYGGLLVITFFFVLVKPWWRERRLTFDGMFLISWLVAWAVQDAWPNYTVQWFNYNSLFINLGCPQCRVPGWQSPNGTQMTEPLIFMGGMYAGAFLACLLCNVVMRKAKARWPQLGTVGMIGVAFAFMVLLDFLAELVWMRAGTYTYGGAIRELSMGAGHYYQFPVYESLLWGATWAGIACIRYFKDDRGNSLVEKGADRLAVGEGKRAVLRLLALIGVVNVIILVTYNIPSQWLGTHADDFPDEILHGSYYTNMMCGPGSDYACPGPRVPISVGPDSAHTTPEGGFRAPKGLPDQTKNAGG